MTDGRNKYPNSGALFKNDRKELKGHCDFSGKCEVDGVEYYINAWTKEGRSGRFLSLSFKPIAPKPEGSSPPAATGGEEAESFF